MRLLGPGVELELVGRSLARKDGSARCSYHLVSTNSHVDQNLCRRCKDLASYLGLPSCEKREGPKGSPKPRRKDLSSYLGVGQDVLCTVVTPEPPEPLLQSRKAHPQSQLAQAAQSSHANQDNLKARSPPPPPSSTPPPPTDASPSAPSPASSVLPLPIISPHLLNTLHPSSEPSPTSLPLHPPPPPPPSPPPLDTLPPTADIDTDYSWGTEVDSAFSSAASSEYSTIYL